MDTADILPTLLNMLGINYNPMNYIGDDVFSEYHDNFVWFSDGTIISNNSNMSEKEMLAKANLNIIKNRNILLTNYYGR
jgi:phosphoglycerol transferase MdoB-like AlkP superfamily enzyme